MSSAFSIADGNIQRATSLEEVRLAYNERRAALHQAPRYWTGSAWADGDTAISAGTKIQSHLFFTEIQAWVENNCGAWMPPATTSYNNTDLADFKRISELAGDAGETDFQYFCKTIVAGDLASGADYGWRRSVSVGSFTTRGQAQTGDYIRWTSGATYFDLWEDIRACLSKMKITEATSGPGYDNGLYSYYGTGYQGLYKSGYSGGTLAAAQSQYDSSGTATEAEPYANCDSNSRWFMESQSAHVKYYLYPSGPGNMYSLVDTVKIYLETELHSAAASYDDFGVGLYEDKLGLVDSSASPSADGSNYTAALAQVAAGTDFTGFGWPGTGWQATSGTPWRGIIIWNFTNSD